ncbi:AraC family transcriptional regulator [Catenulispora sp. GAS73]|uniref:AraC family transcriptional regulator n=1 Tax=Catenulispora sp. GAS73 TaxID=3156269 RepID=UPI0035131D3C
MGGTADTAAALGWAEYWRDDTRGLEAMHARFRDHVYAPHSHDAYSFGVTDAGAQQFHCRGALHTSAAGMVMALNPDDPHDGRAAADLGYHYRIVHVSPQIVRAVLADAAGVADATDFAGRADLDLTADSGARADLSLPAGGVGRADLDLAAGGAAWGDLSLPASGGARADLDLAAGGAAWTGRSGESGQSGQPGPSNHADPFAAAAPLPLFTTPVLGDRRLADAIAGLHAALAADASPLARDERLRAVILGAHLRGATRPPRIRTLADGAQRMAACRARDLMREAYPETLSVELLAEAAGCSRFALYRAFAAEFGMSPSDYERQLRLRHARALLASGSTPADVAAATGFADQAHLARWFKRAYGITPGVFVRGGHA